jgi:hypothetical protein
MLTFQDCVGLCDLTEDEILAIARHEHVPGIAALELGHYLVRSPAGELVIKAMIRDDLAATSARGDRALALALKSILRDYILRHPCCEARHRAAPGVPERREAA